MDIDGVSHPTQVSVIPNWFSMTFHMPPLRHGFYMAFRMKFKRLQYQPPSTYQPLFSATLGNDIDTQIEIISATPPWNGYSMACHVYHQHTYNDQWQFTSVKLAILSATCEWHNGSHMSISPDRPKRHIFDISLGYERYKNVPELLLHKLASLGFTAVYSP